MKLSRLTLENFRCFEAATFDLSDPDEHDIDVPLDVVVLVGENGSGKSAVLDAITGAVSYTPLPLPTRDAV